MSDSLSFGTFSGGLRGFPGPAAFVVVAVVCADGAEVDRLTVQASVFSEVNGDEVFRYGGVNTQPGVVFETGSGATRRGYDAS